MKYDFKSTIDRKDTGSVKWESMYQWNPDVSNDVLPLSVADMEFKTAPEITNGLKKFLDNNVLGYTLAYENFLNSVTYWQNHRHQWQIKADWIVNTTGVVGALNAAVKAVSKEGDGIITFPVVYPPFTEAIQSNNRTLVDIDLINNDGYYTIDFDQFEEEAAKSTNKALLFCNPHNPVGRVWTRDELERMAQIAVKYNLFVISDDIWNDIVMPGYKYIPLASLNKQIADLTITCSSPSKSFNLAGLCVSNIIISNPELRQSFEVQVEKMQIGMVNILGYKACELAYLEAEDWLDELLEIVNTNQKIVHDFVSLNSDKLSVQLIEGTYVQWLNCKKLLLSDTDLDQFMFNDAQFFSSPGYTYGQEGSGYHRINLALASDKLQANLSRLQDALNKL